MRLTSYALLWLLGFLFTSLIDALWHFVLFGKAYREGLKLLARMREGRISPRFGAALLAQVLVVTSLVVLVSSVAGGGTVMLAAAVGGLAGVLAISVYGVTNYALFKDWSLLLTWLEFVWGPILGALSGAFLFWAGSWLGT
jgi:uncharacterized membrane protein